MSESERERLLATRAAGTTLRSKRVITISQGYAIGADLERLRLADGGRHVGWKLGFTNQALWAALGLERPFCAPVYAETLASEDVDVQVLVQPRIEPEIVVGFDRDVAARCKPRRDCRVCRLGGSGPGSRALSLRQRGHEPG